MKIVGTAGGGPLAQSFAQFFGTLRAGKESFEQRAQVQSGSSHYDRQMAVRFDLLKHLPRLAGVFAGCDVAGGRGTIDQVMWDAVSLESGRLGRADVEPAVHGDRIAVHDLAM